MNCQMVRDADSLNERSRETSRSGATISQLVICLGIGEEVYLAVINVAEDALPILE